LRVSEEPAAETLVSIIVPAFNAELTIRETLLSALASTYKTIEVIVVDDGSTDRTPAIVEEFALEDRRIQLHQRIQGGVSAALNLGLKHARGDYVARLDSDDIWHPTKLEKQMKAAAADPTAALIHACVRYIDGESRVVRDVAPQAFPKHALCRCLYEGFIGGNSSVLLRRDAVEQAGGYDEALTSWEDMLLYLTVAAEHPIAFVPEYLVGYRIRPGSLSADTQNMHDSWRLARERFKERFPRVPRRVHRWAHGSRVSRWATSFLLQGRYGFSARLLLEGSIYDPAWLAAFLSYRLGHRFSRRTTTVAQSEGPRFVDCSPEKQYKLSSFDLGLEGRRFRRFEEKRKRELDLLDVKMMTAADGV